MTSSARILLAGFTGVAGHVGRLLAVTDLLRRVAPTEISMLGAGRFAPHARQAGVAVIDTPERPLDLFGLEEDLARRVLSAWFRIELADDLAVLARERPDCVVVDGRWPTVAAARQLGVPVVTITNTVWTRARRNLALANEWQFRAFSTLFRDAVAPTLALIQSPLDPELEGFQEGDHTHVADLVALTGQLDTPLHATRGPLMWRPAGAAAIDWPRGPGRTVYMTSGSTGAEEKVASAAETLAARGHRVVLSGSPVDDARPGIVRTRFCDADRLLRSADIAVVHGGSGSLLQSLEFGVPMVVCPANLDQVAHGELLERSGAGVCVTEAARIVGAVEHVCDDSSFRARAQDLASAMRSEMVGTELSEAIIGITAGARA